MSIWKYRVAGYGGPAAIGALVASIGVFGALAGCSGPNGEASAKPAAAPATPVIMEAVELLPEQTRLEAVGTSRARKSVILHPVAAGEVVAIHFKAGQKVAAGDTLLELDSRDQALAVKLARVRLAEAERLYHRYRRSQDSGVVTRAALDDARSAVEAARIELGRAQVALDDCTVKAPFAGFIGITDVDVGDRIDPDTPIASLDDRSALLVTFAVPEILIQRLNVGDTISVAAWGARDREAQGRVVEIASRIDPSSRTFPVRAEVDNADDLLRPGMSFRVNLQLDGAHYPAVPEVAVQWGGDGAYVWAVRDGKARRVSVTIVQRRHGKILIDAGLDAGTPVVVEGVQRMRDGMAVSDYESTASARAVGGGTQ